VLGPADGGCQLIDRAVSYRSSGTFGGAGPRSPPGITLLNGGAAGRTTVQLHIAAVVEQVETVAGPPDCSPGPQGVPLIVVWRPGCDGTGQSLALPARSGPGRTVIVGCHGIRGFSDPGSGENGVENLDLGGSFTLRPVTR
jgi:hypothetical protein